MKTYRVWRQEVVMYHNEVEAKNKTEAYEKALDLDFDADKVPAAHAAR